MQPSGTQIALLDNIVKVHLLLTICYSHTLHTKITAWLLPPSTSEQQLEGKNKTPLTNLKAEVRVKLTEHLTHAVSLNPGQLQEAKNKALGKKHMSYTVAREDFVILW